MQKYPEEQNEQTRRDQLLVEANRQYALLRADAAAWQEELKERAVWDGTLMYGLDEDLQEGQSAPDCDD